MKYSTYSRTLKFIIYFIEAIVFIGLAIDALKKSISIFPFPVYLIISIVFSSGVAFLLVYIKKRTIKLKFKGGESINIKKLGIKTKAGLAGILIILWLATITLFCETYPQEIKIRMSRAKSDELLILIADFMNDSQNNNYDISGSIELALGEVQELEENALCTKIRIERVSKSFYRNQVEDVKTLANRYNATIIIWGYYDDAGVFPYFTIVKDEAKNILSDSPSPFPIPQVDSPEPNLSNFANPLENPGLYIHQDLPLYIKYLTQFTLGELFFTMGDFCAGNAFFEAAIENSEGIHDIEKIKESLEASFANSGLNHWINCVITRSEYSCVDAIEMYTKALEMNSDPRYYFYIGDVKFSNEEYQTAVEYFSKFINMIDENQNEKDLILTNGDNRYIIYKQCSLSDAYFKRGKSYYFLNKLEEAIYDLDQSIILNTENGDAYFIRGFLFQGQGEFEKAIKDFEKAVSLAPDEYGDNIGNFYYRLGELDFALEYYTRAIELEPGSYVNYHNRGLVYFYSYQFEKAIVDFTFATELNPYHDKSYNFKGQCLSELKRHEEAIIEYEKAINIDNNIPEYYYDYAIDVYMLGDLEGAINYFSRAINIDPEYSEAYLNRGSTYLSLEKINLAKDDFRKILSYETDTQIRQIAENALNSLP